MSEEESSDSEDEVKSLDDDESLSVEEKIERGRQPLKSENDDNALLPIASYRHTLGSGAVGIDKSRVILSSCLCVQNRKKLKKRQKKGDETEKTKKIVFYGTEDGFIHVWHVDREQRITRFKAHQQNITALTSSCNGSRIWSACADGSVHVWRVNDFVRLGSMNAHNDHRIDALCTVVAKDDRDCVWACSAGGASLCIWSSQSSNETTTTTKISLDDNVLIEHDAFRGACAMIWHKATGRVWIGTDKGYALALDALEPDLDALEEIRWRAHLAPINALVGVGDDQVWTASEDHRIRCWSARNFALLRSLHAHSEPIGALQVFGPDYVASADNGGNIMLWPQRAETMQPDAPYARTLLLCPVARNRWARHNGAINTLIALPSKYKPDQDTNAVAQEVGQDTYTLWSAGADTAIHLWQLNVPLTTTAMSSSSSSSSSRKKRKDRKRDKTLPSSSSSSSTEKKKRRRKSSSSSSSVASTENEKHSSRRHRHRHRSKHNNKKE